MAGVEPEPKCSDLLLSLNASNALSLADRKRHLFVKVLKEEFLAELHYVWDVANGRAAPRDTLTQKIVSQLQDIASDVSIVGPILQKLGDIAVFAANYVRDQRLQILAQLKDELDMPRLEILLDVVAREALRRYESFIVDRLNDDPVAGVIPFAKVGARRMLERLSRYHQQTEGGSEVTLSESSLLAGLIEGHSGSFVEGFSNHKLTLSRKKKNFLQQEKIKTVDAETVYGRPGFRYFEIHSGALIDQLYIREKAKHQELPDWKKAASLLKGNTDALYQFGCVQFHKNRRQMRDPKAGFVLMPLAVIKDRYDFHPHSPLTFTEELQSELRASSHSRIVIDRATVAAYLEWQKQGQNKSLLDYIHEVLHYPLIQYVICRDDLSGLVLRSVNLSHTDLSGAVLEGDLTETNFSDSYLVGAVFKPGTIAKKAHFQSAHCEYLQADQIDFSGSDFTQAHFSYASLQKANLVGCKTLGTIWHEACLTGVTTDTDLLEEQRLQAEQFKKDVAEEHQALREQARVLDAQLQALRQAHGSLQQQIQGCEEKLAGLPEKMQQLIVQQESRLIFENTCEADLKAMKQKLEQVSYREDAEQLEQAIQATQVELKQLQENKPWESAIQVFANDFTQKIASLSESQAELKQVLSGLGQAFQSQYLAQTTVQEKRFGVLEKSLHTLQEQITERVGALEKQVQGMESRLAAQESKLVHSDPHYTTAVKVKKWRDSILNDPFITEELAYYIPPQGQSHLDSQLTEPLQAWIEKEFLDSSADVLLLQGIAGSGKSTFNRHLLRHLWKETVWESFQAGDPPPEQWLPVFIPLGSGDVNPQRIFDYLKNLPELAEGFTDAEIALLKNHYRLLVIADGYDEIRGNPKVNVYEDNHLSQWRGHIKLLVSYQTQRIQGLDETICFAPKGGGRVYKERYISPFTEEQIQRYIEGYLKKNQAAKKSLAWPRAEMYKECFKRFPLLQKLINTPFFLLITVEVLPTLKELRLDKPSSLVQLDLTRTGLYDRFMEAWFTREAHKALAAKNWIEHPEKLLGSEIVVALQAEHQQLGNAGEDKRILYFKKGCMEFCQRLAFELRQSRQTTVKYPLEAKQGGQFRSISAAVETAPAWVSALFDETNPDLLLCRRGSPLRKSAGNEYSFIQASLIDYFYAKEIYYRSSQPELKEPASAAPALPAVSKVDAVALPPPVKSPVVSTETMRQPEKYLGKIRLLRNEIHFLADHVKQEAQQSEQPFTKALLQVIEASKKEANLVIAAANAMTILNAANFNFSAMNLRAVKICGADLSGALMEDTDFTEADLSQVILQGAWMKGAVLQRAKLDGVRFGELPHWCFSKETTFAYAFSPNNRYLAVVRGHDLLVLDTHTHQQKWELKGHHAVINAIAWDVSGLYLASGGKDRKVCVWDVERGCALNTLSSQHTDEVLTLAWDPKGGRFVSGSQDKTLRIWYLNGRLAQEWAKNTAVRSVAWDPSGTYLAIAEDDANIQIWDMVKDKEIACCSGHLDRINHLAWDPQGKRLASCSRDGKILIWYASTGQALRQLCGHTGEVMVSEWDASGERLASGSRDQSIRIWDVTKGETLRQLIGHHKTVMAIKWDSKGRFLASSSRDNTLRIWDITLQAVLRQAPSHAQTITCVAWDPQHPYLASCSYDNTVRIWSERGQELIQFKGHQQSVDAIAWDVQGQRLASASADNTVCIWEVATGLKLRQLVGHQDDVLSVAWETHGQYVASGSSDHTVRIWDVATGKEFNQLKGHQEAVQKVVWHPHGLQLASASLDKTVRIWAMDGKEQQCFEHTRSVTALTWNTTGEHLISGTEDGRIQVWDVRRGQAKGEAIQAHVRSVTNLALNPTEHLLASASYLENTLCIWDRVTLTCVRRMTFPEKITGLAWKKIEMGSWLAVVFGTQIACYAFQKQYAKPILRWLITSASQLCLSGVDITQEQRLQPQCQLIEQHRLAEKALSLSEEKFSTVLSPPSSPRSSSSTAAIMKQVGGVGDQLALSPSSSQLKLSTQNKSGVLAGIRLPDLFPEFKLSSPTSDISRLLLHVVKGEQEEAESLLTKNSKLALSVGSVTDLSQRSFPKITAFQYAVWALDFSMWTMLLKYLPADAAAEQLQKLEKEGTAYGKHFDLMPLITELDTYVKHCETWYTEGAYDQLKEQWSRRVGGAQLLLPANMINEYCHPTRPFGPCPTFHEATLPRSMKLNEGHWFTAQHNGSTLGVTFAVSRYSLSSAGAWEFVWPLAVCAVDHLAMQNLATARQKQLEHLKTQLLKPKSKPPTKKTDQQTKSIFT